MNKRERAAALDLGVGVMATWYVCSCCRRGRGVAVVHQRQHICPGPTRQRHSHLGWQLFQRVLGQHRPHRQASFQPHMLHHIKQACPALLIYVLLLSALPNGRLCCAGASKRLQGSRGSGASLRLSVAALRCRVQGHACRLRRPRC